MIVALAVVGWLCACAVGVVLWTRAPVHARDHGEDCTCTDCMPWGL